MLHLSSVTHLCWQYWMELLHFSEATSSPSPNLNFVSEVNSCILFLSSSHILFQYNILVILAHILSWWNCQIKCFPKKVSNITFVYFLYEKSYFTITALNILRTIFKPMITWNSTLLIRRIYSLWITKLSSCITGRLFSLNLLYLHLLLAIYALLWLHVSFFYVIINSFKFVYKMYNIHICWPRKHLKFVLCYICSLTEIFWKQWFQYTQQNINTIITIQIFYLYITTSYLYIFIKEKIDCWSLLFHIKICQTLPCLSLM